jgi:FMN phosphatase YigB (HAD superfamily)
MNIKAILFDLGGVLVDWDGISPLIDLTDVTTTPEQARRFWLEFLWASKRAIT